MPAGRVDIRQRPGKANTKDAQHEAAIHTNDSPGTRRCFIEVNYTNSEFQPVSLRMFPRLSRLTQGDSDSRCTLKIKSWPCEVVGKDMVKRKEKLDVVAQHDMVLIFTLKAPDSWQP